MSHVYVLQHVATEPAGIIIDALASENIGARYVRPFEGEPVPKDLTGAAGLVVMGGPMGVREESKYPFLRDEVRLIENALRGDKPVLGVCLGSQLLASALGAEVRRGRKKEIGWRTITLAEQAATDLLWRDLRPSFTAYHWHGDVFDLPQGAKHLASSDGTACQAFCYGSSAYGFLFHMEATEKIIGDMVEIFSDELHEEGIDGREITGRIRDYLPALQETGRVVFRRWAGLIERDVERDVERNA